MIPKGGYVDTISGSTALYRDESKLQLQPRRGPQNAKSSIDIYSSAGKLIRQILVRARRDTL